MSSKRQLIFDDFIMAADMCGGWVIVIELWRENRCR